MSNVICFPAARLGPRDPPAAVSVQTSSPGRMPRRLTACGPCRARRQIRAHKLSRFSFSLKEQ